MGFLTGKTTPATSENKAFPWIQSTYSPQAQQGVGATNQLSALLGLGGDQDAANQAFSNFRNSSGYQNIFNEAMRGVTNSAAGRGLLSSGATGRALTTTAGNLANQSFGNYLSQLSGLSGLGLQAGSLIGGAGSTSTGEKRKAGLLDYAGGIASILSDRRTKEDITYLESFDDGLKVYEFRYLGEPDYHVGVMADEVEIFRPWALGPVTPEGFQTVNYEAL